MKLAGIALTLSQKVIRILYNKVSNIFPTIVFSAFFLKAVNYFNVGFCNRIQ